MSTSKDHPIRILHVVDRMSAGGGVQNWLMQVLRKVDRQRFHMDFQAMEAKTHDDEIRALGSQIFISPPHRNPFLYAGHLQKILTESAPYDIVHCHSHYYSGHVLRVAARLGIPVRIAHSHVTTHVVDAQLGMMRQLYHRVMLHWIRQYATAGLSCSRDAAPSLFGPAWETDSRWQLHYYGIDLEPFSQRKDTASIRAELGIPQDAFVIGHIGRFTEQKNHPLLIDIAIEVAKRKPQTYLLLVGDGPLLPAIKEKVQMAGMADRVVFAGLRNDIPRLLLGAMDVFAFPSLYEGLGLVALEAQAAGVPVILSDQVPHEVEVIKPLITRIGLSQPVSVWADAILAAKEPKTSMSQEEALRIVDQSVFSLRTEIRELEEYYNTVHLSKSRA